MTLDPNYKVPEGFEPVLNYPDGVNGIPMVGCCALPDVGRQGLGLEFWIAKVIPALPLKGYGELWHTGWAIPTCWAVDAVGQCWKDDAHGHCLEPVEPEALLGTCESHQEKVTINRLLGRPEPEPEWMAAARAAGWHAPNQCPGKP